MDFTKFNAEASLNRQYSTDGDTPSTHVLCNARLSVIGGVPTRRYHTETLPCTRRITPGELEAYRKNTTSFVGRKFIPVNGEDLWEVEEVIFSRKGWSCVMQSEGQEGKRRMVLEDFMGMLGNGVVLVVEAE